MFKTSKYTQNMTIIQTIFMLEDLVREAIVVQETEETTPEWLTGFKFGVGIAIKLLNNLKKTESTS